MGSERKAAKKNPDAKMVVEGSGNRVIGSGNKEITDERFALSQKDPRFQDVPRHKTKVVIDSRFGHVFTDKNFSTSSARVDKRGRSKQDGDSSQSALRHYYRMDNEEKKHKKQVQDDKGEYESDESISETESSGEEKGKEDYTSTDTDEEDEVYLEEETTATGLQLQENIPVIYKGTHRLAVVRMDWNQVKAVDLFVLLSSFLPKTGQILSVSVYPSEFGLERMKEEDVHGPVDLFNDEDQESDNDDNEIDNEKLRAYELSRLRYYFAVVVCDSSDTAEYLYMSCDGVEFEKSSNILDLRFIPDSMEFEQPPRDVAKEAPPDYEGIDFQTRALQQSKVDSTWDGNDPERSETLTRNFNIVDEESVYVKHEQRSREYIASSETDEDENGKKTDEYRALAQSGDENKDEDDKGMEMEVTFNTGLEDLSKKILEKKHEKSETVWDAVLRKKKEKKKARKDECIGYDSDREEVADFFLGDKKLELGKEGVASKATLELLLGGDDDGKVRGYNSKKNKSKGKKRKRQGMDKGKIPTADHDDPRFSSIYTRHDFALDPTDPRYKRSAVYERQSANKQHKADMDRKGKGIQQHEPTHAAAEVDKIDSKKEKHDISMLVKCIKMKSKRLPLSSDGNKSR